MLSEGGESDNDSQASDHGINSQCLSQHSSSMDRASGGLSASDHSAAIESSEIRRSPRDTKLTLKARENKYLELSNRLLKSVDDQLRLNESFFYQELLCQ